MLHGPRLMPPPVMLLDHCMPMFILIKYIHTNSLIYTPLFDVFVIVGEMIFFYWKINQNENHKKHQQKCTIAPCSIQYLCRYIFNQTLIWAKVQQWSTLLF